MNASSKVNHDTRWVFLKKGTCSRTFFYILNREFENPREPEERAIDPMAGGILQQGYQCGQLWGAVMAAGTEAYKRTINLNKATALAIKASQTIIESFVKKQDHLIAKILYKPILKRNMFCQNYLFQGSFLNVLNWPTNGLPMP